MDSGRADKTRRCVWGGGVFFCSQTVPAVPLSPLFPRRCHPARAVLSGCLLLSVYPLAPSHQAFWESIRSHSTYTSEIPLLRLQTNLIRSDLLSLHPSCFSFPRLVSILLSCNQLNHLLSHFKCTKPALADAAVSVLKGSHLFRSLPFRDRLLSQCSSSSFTG